MEINEMSAPTIRFDFDSLEKLSQSSGMLHLNTD